MTRPPKKLLPMLILDILHNYSDAEHRLSQRDIMDILKTEYDMTAYTFEQYLSIISPKYRKGETVYPEESFDDHLLADGSGIHFFLTRTEAELYEIRDDDSEADGEDCSEEGTT